MYISDQSFKVVRVVNSAGIITTFAGTVSGLGSLTDGGAATSTDLYGPYGVAVDGNGNVYIADSGANKVRVVNKNGIITTFAGNSNFATPYSGDNGPATSASLNNPKGVAVDNNG